jgi:hypothetical protein
VLATAAVAVGVLVLLAQLGRQQAMEQVGLELQIQSLGHR